MKCYELFFVLCFCGSSVSLSKEIPILEYSLVKLLILAKSEK